jgi:ubiquitin thioesterase ZRANB1
LSVQLNSRLYALWNRSTGDCLLDSCLQATWGLFDKENRLRKALADALTDASGPFFARFRAAELFGDGVELSYTLDRLQWEADWAVVLSLAAQPGQALERFHVFALAHVLRRPIIVYGVKYVKSFRGETLGFAGFQGIYLPLHWEPSFCSSSPIALGYTRGHFTALVPMDSISLAEHVTVSASADSALHCRYLPLVNSDHELLPLHFLTESEVNQLIEKCYFIDSKQSY